MKRVKLILGLVIAILCGLAFGKALTFSINSLSQNVNVGFVQFGMNTTDSIEESQNFNQDIFIIDEIKIDTEPKIELPQTITVTFVGDIMFDRHIRSWSNRNSYDDLFKNVREKLRKSDLVVGNLEGPITNYNTIYTHGSIPYNYTFTFDTRIAKVLKDANFGVVSLDNNHIFDYGRDGAKQTIENLKSVGISYFGNPDDRKVLYKNVNNIRLAFLSYNQFILPDVTNLLRDIREANQNSDYVIVFPHWGNEYEFLPTENQVLLAHQFIDNGADIVIGAHPHVIQSKEIYKGKHIYYSLGNFVFDQYFNEDVKCGAVITFKLSKNEVIDIKEKFSYLSADKIVEFKDCYDGFN